MLNKSRTNVAFKNLCAPESIYLRHSKFNPLGNSFASYQRKRGELNLAPLPLFSFLSLWYNKINSWASCFFPLTEYLNSLHCKTPVIFPVQFNSRWHPSLIVMVNGDSTSAFNPSVPNQWPIKSRGHLSFFTQVLFLGNVLICI